jgi:hypothetical protein
MMRIVAALVFFLLGAGAAWAEPCHYYASPNGRGNGRSDASPFRIADFWPGTALCLVDGIHRAIDYMMSSTLGLGGARFVIEGVDANLDRDRAAAVSDAQSAAVVAPPPPSSVTVRYASATGRGEAPCTASAPCSVATALVAAVSGNVVELLGGTMAAPVVYRGSSAMINPPKGKGGEDGRPITVRCSVDGGCLLDGQFERIPIRLAHNNNWWVIEGVDAKNGAGAAKCTRAGAALQLAASSNNIFRRVIVWDACAITNSHVVSIQGGSHGNLFEDFAAFGMGRKVISIHRADRNTFRRCWTRWDGGLTGGHDVLETFYLSKGNVFENCLASWSGEAMPQTYTTSDGTVRTNFEPSVSGSLGISVARIESSTTPKFANVIVRASIAYVKSTARLPTITHNGAPVDSTPIVSFYGASNMQLLDVVAVMSPDHSRFNLHHGFALSRAPQHGPLRDGQCRNPLTPTYPCPTTGNSATRLTSIRGGKGDFFHPDWVVTGVSAGTSLGDVQTPWQDTSVTGARVCHRTVNGSTAGNIPLWPWPMNDRIKAATAAARSYSGPCPTCAGLPIRTETDVTADIEGLLGSIPPTCRK